MCILCSKIENPHWAEKMTTTRFGIRETTTMQNCVLWPFVNNHNALWHERKSHNAKSFKWTVYKFSNLLIKNTCNVGLMKNNGEALFFLQELLEWHTELHFIFFKWHLHFLLMQYLLQWQLTNPCLLPDVIIEADQRDSELDGTSCALMKSLSAAVISLRAYSCSSWPSFVPNR